MLQLIHHAPFPVMALAHGAVIGAGADLFAACWQRVAAPGSRFRMPGWNFDLALGTRRLARLIGADHARDMLIDTRQIDADRAHEIGLATDILPDDEWELCIDTFRARVQVLSPEAVKSMLELTVVDSRSDDLAAIVDTAGRPGLKERILAYRARVQAAKR
jgi:enoyl-CoA hydratase/carnithine racemase